MTVEEIEAALQGAIDGFCSVHGGPPERLVVSPAAMLRLTAEWLSDGWREATGAVKYHGVLLVSDPYLPPHFVLACGPEPRDVAMAAIAPHDAPPPVTPVATRSDDERPVMDTLFELTLSAGPRVSEAIDAVHDHSPHESARDRVREVFVEVAVTLEAAAEWGETHDWYVAVDNAAERTCAALLEDPDGLSVTDIVRAALDAAAT